MAPKRTSLFDAAAFLESAGLSRKIVTYARGAANQLTATKDGHTLQATYVPKLPPGAGVEIIAGECALPPRIELALRIEGQGMRRYDHALAQQREHLRRPVGPTQSHRSLKMSGGHVRQNWQRSVGADRCR